MMTGTFSLAFFGVRIIVCNRTPSRIGIMTSLFSYARAVSALCARAPWGAKPHKSPRRKALATDGDTGLMTLILLMLASCAGRLSEAARPSTRRRVGERQDRATAGRGSVSTNESLLGPLLGALSPLLGSKRGQRADLDRGHAHAP